MESGNSVGHRGIDRRPGLLSGWGWLAVLRLGLALAIGIYAATYVAAVGHPEPRHVRPLTIGIAVCLVALAIIQLSRGRHLSRRLAVISFWVDAAAVLGALALYSFDPRRYLFALVVVVQAEGGVVLGLGGGLTAWAATSLSYVAAEFLTAHVSGGDVHPVDVAVRLAAGLLLALGGGSLSEVLSGERQHRLVERKSELRRLQAAEARYRSLVEKIPVITYIDAIDRTSSAIFISPQVEEIMGYRPDEWINDPELWTKLLHPEDRSRIKALNDRTNVTEEPFRSEYRLIAKDGRIVWVRDEATLMRDDEGQPLYWQGVMVDITERKLAEEEVTFLAYHDRLTGLPNREMFRRVLDLALARARRRDLAVAVLYMDLDNFKEVNDTLGHAVGDEVLRQVADRLSRAVRATDVVARQGGDEFLVLLADLERDGGGVALGALALAEAVADRVHDSLKSPFVARNREFHLSASVGVSYFPVSADDAEDLLKRADDAMYRSKRTAPGSTVFAEEAQG